MRCQTDQCQFASCSWFCQCTAGSSWGHDLPPFFFGLHVVIGRDVESAAEGFQNPVELSFRFIR